MEWEVLCVDSFKIRLTATANRFWWRCLSRRNHELVISIGWFCSTMFTGRMEVSIIFCYLLVVFVKYKPSQSNRAFFHFGTVITVFCGRNNLQVIEGTELELTWATGMLICATTLYMLDFWIMLVEITNWVEILSW